MLGFCHCFCKSYTVFGILNIVLHDTLEVASCRGLNLQANVTVEVVLHLLGSMLWPTFKYLFFLKMWRKNNI